MKILSCHVSNFASYKHLEFKFDDQGLTLISGPTGSGKSTLCDVVPWILFGKTAKGGTVDEIRSWGSEAFSVGRIYLEINGRLYSIYRRRGPKASDNDLTFEVDTNFNISTGLIRGRDLNDTQKQINNLLGFDYDLYMSAAYFHEFSTTAQFFTTTAKIRRQITEQLVDLSLAKKLVEHAGAYRKELKDELKNVEAELLVAEGILKSTKQYLKQDKARIESWNNTHGTKIADLVAQRDRYVSNKDKQLVKALKEHNKKQKELEVEYSELQNSLMNATDLEFLRASLEEDKRQFELTKSSKCLVCGSSTSSTKEILLIRRENDLSRKELENEGVKRALALKVKELQRSNDTEKVIINTDEENPYDVQLNQALEETNPFIKMVEDREESMKTMVKKAKDIKKAFNEFKQELSDIELLLDVTDTFRSLLVKNTVVDLENNTNKILHDYFDAEIQVKFELSDADKLEAIITKDGNEASFTQLSKGQRQLLKLAFGVSIMKCVSNHHGINFNALFMDEALDGLDDVLKVKAFDLLQQLATEHESVFVVEHNEALKSLFPKRYEVSLVNGDSQIGEA